MARLTGLPESQLMGGGGTFAYRPLSERLPRAPRGLAHLYLTGSLQVEDLVKRLLHSVTESNHAMVS